MTATLRERLYALLPAVARIRDARAGEPLRALLAIMEEELDRVEADIEQLYENCFIETCSEWAVPYIGDLISARLLYAVSQRAFTANTLAYRRRKGTLRILGSLARDVTRWPARAVEYRQLVAVVQNVNAVRPDRVIVPDLRRQDDLQDLDTPFERTARTVSVRGAGKHQLNQVGLFVWRLASYRLEQVRAVPAGPGFFYMDPLGCDRELWSPCRSRPELLATTELPSAPQPLRRLALHEALEARRQATVLGRTSQDPYFDDQPVLRIFVADADGNPTEVPAEQIMVAELDDFFAPPGSRSYASSLGGSGPVAAKIAAAVDPRRGRLAFPAGVTPDKVWVSFYYGFSGELGGGGYYRPAPVDPDGVKVITLPPGDPQGVLQSLATPDAAGSPWSGAAGSLIIEIPDSDTYTVGAIRVPANATLELRARPWRRPLCQPEPAAGGSAPSLSIALEEGATLALSGLLVASALAISGVAAAGAAVPSAALRLSHCTLVPGARLLADGSPAFAATASIRASGAALTVTLDSSICGAIDLSAAQGGEVRASDSIIDAARASHPAIQATTASLARVTVLGRTQVSALRDTVDTLFSDVVAAPAGPAAAVSYCHLPPGSTVLQPFRCQPELALSEPGVDRDRILAIVRPWFVSCKYGAPGYAQLDVRCADVLRNGASVEGEVGAFQSLKTAPREANLRASQAEYLRFGVTLNLFPVS